MNFCCETTLDVCGMLTLGRINNKTAVLDYAIAVKTLCAALQPVLGERAIFIGFKDFNIYLALLQKINIEC